MLILMVFTTPMRITKNRTRTAIRETVFSPLWKSTITLAFSNIV